MKKSIFLSTLLLVIMQGNIFAQTSPNTMRSQSEVINIANEYFSKKQFIQSQKVRTSNKNRIRAASEILGQPQTRKAQKINDLSPQDEAFYIIDNTDGFVIVSGDERMIPILGYSDNPSDLDNMPLNMRSWLSFYGKEFAALQEQKTPLSINANKKSAKASIAFPPAVGALLNGIAYDQKAPYYDRCPIKNEKRCLTGCVATAMSQIMAYHKYPERGTGVIQYTPNNFDFELNEDLASEPFDWVNMSKGYGSGSSEASKKAVAWLMYAAGLSVKMKYDTDWSSASGLAISGALAKHFSYDPGGRYVLRDNYVYSDWRDLLKKELSEGRPVLYEGQNYSSGHSFVIDGYDGDYLFHVNWGWGGGGDGYYTLTSMKIGFPGLDGYFEGGFNIGQAMAIGVQKPVVPYKYQSLFMVFDGSITLNYTTIARQGTFSITEQLYLNFTDLFTSGVLQPVLFQNGTAVAPLGTAFIANNIDRKDGVTAGFTDITIPTSLANGTYQLYICSKDNRESQWQKVNMPIKNTYYYNVVVTNDKVEFQNPINTKGLTLTSCNQLNKLYEKLSFGFDLTGNNIGSEWTGRVGVRLQSIADPSAKPLLVVETKVNYLEGEFKFHLEDPVLRAAPGDYTLIPSYSYDGLTWHAFQSQNKTVTVYPKPTTNSYTLTVLSIKDETNPLLDDNSIFLNIKIANDGTGPFSEKIKLEVFASTVSGYSTRVASIIDDHFIDNGSTINLNPNLGILPANSYKAVIYYGVTASPFVLLKEYFFTVSAVTYSVSFNSNGGSPISTITTNENKIIAKPNDPNKVGSTFEGWYKESALKNVWNFAVDKVTTNTTLYAKWTTATAKFAVFFNSNGGSTIVTINNITAGTTITEPANPNKVGSTFEGWYKESALKNVWNFTVDKVTTNTTLYAKWVAATAKFAVFFNSNGGSTIVTINNITAGTTITKPANPNKAGSTFEGWYKESALKNVWNFTVDKVTTNTTLYAKWVAATAKFAVFFNSNGGSTIVTINNITAGTTITKPANPNKAGSTFEGWYKESALKNVWNFTVDKVTTNTTLYAKWVAATAKFAVFFNSNGGSTIVTINNITAGTTITKPANPNKAGSNFEGWYKESALKNVWNFAVDKVTTNTTVYAKWTTVTGIFDTKVADLKVYPNPATTILNIENIDQTETTTVEIFDISGRLVLQIPVAEVIDISALSQGIYTVKIGNYRSKMMKR